MSEPQYVTAGPGLPRWSNPSSHAVVVGGTCYVSGQLSVGEDGTYLPGTAAGEAERAFANFLAEVAAAGFTREQVAFVDVALADLADLPAVNAVYAALWAEGRGPARTVYQAAALPFGGKVKVTGVAARA
jgi:enamine deaminase RidA (YjgF/YER057c/UK114 family)